MVMGWWWEEARHSVDAGRRVAEPCKQARVDMIMGAWRHSSNLGHGDPPNFVQPTGTSCCSTARQDGQETEARRQLRR